MRISDPVRGFTLLEMLVVMLIAGMALLLTTQALGQYQRAHTRAIASERSGREQRSSEAWFRDSVRGLHATAPQEGNGDDGEAFAGTAEGFAGTTLEPVLSGQGIPTHQDWRIVRGNGGGDRLELAEGDHRIVLALPYAGALRLHYLDAKGGLHDAWPPALGAWPQLPDAILLELQAADGERGGAAIIASAVLGPKDPMDVPFEDVIQ